MMALEDKFQVFLGLIWLFLGLMIPIYAIFPDDALMNFLWAAFGFGCALTGVALVLEPIFSEESSSKLKVVSGAIWITVGALIFVWFVVPINIIDKITWWGFVVGCVLTGISLLFEESRIEKVNGSIWLIVGILIIVWLMLPSEALYYVMWIAFFPGCMLTGYQLISEMMKKTDQKQNLNRTVFNFS